MKDSPNDIYDVRKTVFTNRGIEDYKRFENACKSESSTYPYSMLNNIDKAMQCLLHHIAKKSNVHIVVDCDVDGYTSAAEMYLYLQSLGAGLNLSYSVHQSKKHGLSSDISIPQDTDLLIIPDAGSNDIEQCKKLFEAGIDVLVLDYPALAKTYIPPQHPRAACLGNYTPGY